MSIQLKDEEIIMKRFLRYVAFGVVLLLPQAVGWAGHIDLSGAPSDTWAKESGIRLDLGPEDPPGTVGLHTPFVYRFPDGTLRMYYDPFRTLEMRSAVSTDGINWTKEPGTRLQGVFHPHVVEAGNGVYRMYFESHGDILPTGIGSATSTDGLNWTLEPGVRVSGVDPIVVEIGEGSLRMYFRQGVPDKNIRSAISSDGLSWTVEPGVRIPDAQEFAAVRLPDGVVIIYYAKGTPDFQQILSARTSDGLNFIPDPGARLLPGNHPDSNPLDAGGILTTSIIEFPGGIARMYYQGSSTSDINNPSRVFSAVANLEAPEVVPTLSEWGLIIFALVLLSSLVFYLHKRKNSLQAAP